MRTTKGVCGGLWHRGKASFNLPSLPFAWRPVPGAVTTMWRYGEISLIAPRLSEDTVASSSHPPSLLTEAIYRSLCDQIQATQSVALEPTSSLFPFQPQSHHPLLLYVCFQLLSFIIMFHSALHREAVVLPLWIEGNVKLFYSNVGYEIFVLSKTKSRLK